MNSNEPKFSADLYRDGRPLYPKAIFRGLERALGSTPSISFPIFLDLGCGTGQSTRSFLELGISQTGFALDPDAAMITLAGTATHGRFPDVGYSVASAESMPLPANSVDLVLVGSAIHWFDLSLTRPEIERVLKPGGFLFVFEYQFPKCLTDANLEEIVRRRFNLEWKAPNQKPRGTLSEILAPFSKSEGWTLESDERPEWRERLSLSEFLGLLFSQSRYLHAEAAVSDPIAYRQEVASFFTPYFREEPPLFDFKPRALVLKKQSC